MTNTSYRDRKLYLAFSPDFMIQAGFDTPILAANLTGRHPQNTRSFHSLIPFREQFRDCTGEFITKERIAGKISKFSFPFDCTAKLLAGWYAYLLGTAAAKTGTPANEVQSIALGGGTAGGFKLKFDFEGISATSGVLAHNPTTADVQAALDALRSIKPANTLVAGSGPFTVTFQNDLAKTNVPMIEVVDDTTTGGTGVVVTQTTPGGQNLHALTLIDTYKPPSFSVVEGFDGETLGAKRYKNLKLDEWTINASRRGKMQLTITAFGDPIPEVLPSFSVPACVNPEPMRTADCRIKIGNDWITDDLREFTYTEKNNLDVSEDALKFDDITPDELERGDREASVNIYSLGSPTDSMYEFAEAEDTAFAATEFHLGIPGERLSIYNPNVQYHLDDKLIEFTGARNKSAFRLIGRPSPDNSLIVTRGDYVGDFTGRFLANA